MDDLVAFNVFLGAHIGQLRRARLWGGVGALLVSGGAAYWQHSRAGRPEAAVALLAAGILAAGVWALWAAPWRQRSSIRSVVRRLYGEAALTLHRVTVTEHGIHETRSQGDAFHSWSGIREIARTDDHLFVFVGRTSAHIIPVAAFPSKGDADAFFAAVRERKARWTGSHRERQPN